MAELSGVHGFEAVGASAEFSAFGRRGVVEAGRELFSYVRNQGVPNGGIQGLLTESFCEGAGDAAVDVGRVLLCCDIGKLVVCVGRVFCHSAEFAVDEFCEVPAVFVVWQGPVGIRARIEEVQIVFQRFGCDAEADL